MAIRSSSPSPFLRLVELSSFSHTLWAPGPHHLGNPPLISPQFVNLYLYWGAWTETQLSRCGVTSAEQRGSIISLLTTLLLSLTLAFFTPKGHCWILFTLSTWTKLQSCFVFSLCLAHAEAWDYSIPGDELYICLCWNLNYSQILSTDCQVPVEYDHFFHHIQQVSSFLLSTNFLWVHSIPLFMSLIKAVTSITCLSAPEEFCSLLVSRWTLYCTATTNSPSIL